MKRSTGMRHVYNLGGPLLASAALALSTATATATARRGTATAGLGAPVVVTGAVSHERGITPLLEGVVNPDGEATTYYFQYGATTAYASITATASLPAGSAAVKVELPAPGILPGYHYRVVATNTSGTRVGKDRIYTTKATKEKFVFPKTSEAVVYGHPFILSGTLEGLYNANRALQLRASAYPYKTGYTVVGEPVLTDVKGRFSFLVPNMTASTKFRVYTIARRPVVSRIFTKRVAVSVTLKVRARGPKGLVRVYGTVTPAEVGARIYVQLREPSKRKGGKREGKDGAKFATEFSAVVKRGTLTISRYSAVLTVLEQGRYRAYVVVKKGPLVSGASTTVVLSEKPGAKLEARREKKLKQKAAA